MRYQYRTKGTCSREITVDLDPDNIIRSVEFVGGCDGNLQGISKLVQGQDASKVIETLRGIRCGQKQTSCPDQLSYALEEAQRAFHIRDKGVIHRWENGEMMMTSR